MKQNICKNCGAHSFLEENGYFVCEYCNSKYLVTSVEVPQPIPKIALDEDIKLLLKKCQDDPIHANRYAGLVLDIDPNNKEAVRYLMKK
jgi:DNA-directed RNA polymerase subunit RPC12/RpoP